MSSLLGVHALIALCWPTHEHHLPMLAWFWPPTCQGWATTAFTQAAFVRIVSQQVFAGRAMTQLLASPRERNKHGSLPVPARSVTLKRCSSPAPLRSR